jgi:hypothetical protein
MHSRKVLVLAVVIWSLVDGVVLLLTGFII